MSRRARGVGVDPRPIDLEYMSWPIDPLRLGSPEVYQDLQSASPSGWARALTLADGQPGWLIDEQLYVTMRLDGRFRGWWSLHWGDPPVADCWCGWDFRREATGRLNDTLEGIGEWIRDHSYVTDDPADRVLEPWLQVYDTSWWRDPIPEMRDAKLAAARLTDRATNRLEMAWYISCALGIDVRESYAALTPER